MTAKSSDTRTSSIYFLMIGGFLGAGKTTLISRLARHYTDQGKRVGIVTNDQAYGLVDTENLRNQGFHVGEVPGACFCCKFDDLVETANQLSADQVPDIIIAEPVGSCTDLMATVVRPMREIYGDRFELGPLAVLLKPEHGLKILSGKGKLGFSPKAAYIFEKQLEEANIVVINKIDKLTDQQQIELKRLVEEKYPGKKTISISGRNGENFEDLTKLLEDRSFAVATSMDVDYDVYAEGEAELGWFNCQVSAEADSPFSLDDLVLNLTAVISRMLLEQDSEPAHLKVIGQKNVDAAIANFVVADEPPEMSLESEIHTQTADLIVNARVAAAPEVLRDIVESAISINGQEMGIVLSVSGVQSFQPGRPVPVHRVITPVNSDHLPD